MFKRDVRRDLAQLALEKIGHHIKAEAKSVISLFSKAGRYSLR
jgi:hypothetical protein